MKILIDMNLSPQWASVLRESGYQAIHWSTVGDPAAPDKELLNWAKSHGYILFTHDLDFGAILAVTKTKSPSVLQIRTQDIDPKQIGNLVISVLVQFKEQLMEGALISVNKERSRARILPIKD